MWVKFGLEEGTLGAKFHPHRCKLNTGGLRWRNAAGKKLTILFNPSMQIKGLNVLNVRRFLPISPQLFVAYLSATHDQQAVNDRTILVCSSL